MGDSSSTLRKKAEASKEAAEEKTDGILKMLQELADAKIQQFQSKVRSDSDRHEFKTGKILTEYSEVHLLDDSNTEEIKGFVEGIVDDIASGHISKVITKVIKGGIDAMYATSKGEVCEKSLYTIKLDGIGLQRIDVYMYSYDLTSVGFASEHKSLFVYAYAISTLGEQVKRSDLSSMISQMFADDGANSIQAMADLIQEEEALLNTLTKALYPNSEEDMDEKHDDLKFD